ncbi:hypothetical protein ACET3Z_005863 [Daucus carota]
MLGRNEVVEDSFRNPESLEAFTYPVKLKGAFTSYCLDENSLKVAAHYVLTNMPEVSPYITIFENEVRSRTPLLLSDAEMDILLKNELLIWLEQKDRYTKICADKNIDPTKTSLELWVKAVGGVQKNRILGYPRLRACDILGTTRNTRRVGEGGSGRSTMERLCDDLFMRAVDRTVARAREHPEEFELSPEDVRLLAQDLLDSDGQLPQDHPLTEQTQRDMIHVIIEVFNDLYKRNGPNNKGKAIVDDADNDAGDGDGRGDPDPDDASGGASRTRGGPVIRG